MASKNIKVKLTMTDFDKTIASQLGISKNDIKTNIETSGLSLVKYIVKPTQYNILNNDESVFMIGAGDPNSFAFITQINQITQLSCVKQLEDKSYSIFAHLGVEFLNEDDTPYEMPDSADILYESVPIYFGNVEIVHNDVQI